jgi:16S rRNA (cytosine1402-N4)-methyltransferase
MLDGSDSSDKSGQSQGPKKRRPRYRGTHPRRFEERYKERDPERYSAEAAKARDQGRTPAGAHVPILLAEALERLDLAPGARGADATLGYGGHAAAILERVGPSGFLWAFDRDAIERPKTEARLRARGFANFAAVAANFAEIERELGARQAGRLDFALADLGVSSMQLDDPSRGFSKKRDGPLDLRMDPSQGEPAWAWLEKASEAELEAALRENADEPRASRLARALAEARGKKPLRTTLDLSEAIRRAIAQWPRAVREREGDKPLARAFQAIRIEINREFAALDGLLLALPKILRPGGRAVILSFHSGEDRRVKKAFQAGYRSGVWREIAPDPQRPSPEERRANPRSASAKLRWAERA